MDDEEELKARDFWGLDAQSKLFVIIPFVPPSGNHLYVTNWKSKQRFLSKEGQKFKSEVITYVNQKCLAKIGTLNREGIFALSYVFFFDRDEIFTKTFGSGKKGSAESRYKKMDVENRVKIVSDSIATAIGVDDCQFFSGGHSKMPADFVGRPQIHVFLEELDGKRYGVTA